MSAFSPEIVTFVAFSKDDGSRSKKFQIKPDILIGPRKAPSLNVIDTKWKRLKSSDEDDKNGVSQADMYQMYAYAPNSTNVIMSCCFIEGCWC